MPRAQPDDFFKGCTVILQAFRALRPGAKGKISSLQRGDFAGMSVTAARHMWRKRQVMEAWADGVNREHDLVEDLRACTDPVHEVAIITELGKLQDPERCLAFADRADQQADINACPCSDVWRTSPG